MIPAVTTVRLSGARDRARLPLVVLGPDLGTSATALWSACATHLSDVLDVVAWDLPGHGHNPVVAAEPYTAAELAAGVLRAVDTVLEQRGDVGGAVAWAGVGLGGTIGIQLAVDAPDRLASVVVLDAGARVAGGAGLADVDLHGRLGEVGVPVLAVTGAGAPSEAARGLADGVRDGRLVVLDGVGRLAPVEAPQVVAALVRHHVLGEPLEEAAGPDDGVLREDGVLDRRSRWLVTLTALVVSGRLDDLGSRLREAHGLGVSAAEVAELLRRAAAHAEAPAAEAATRMARQVLAADAAPQDHRDQQDQQDHQEEHA